MAAQDAHRASPPVSQIRRGSAPARKVLFLALPRRVRETAGARFARLRRAHATLKQASCGVSPGARPLAVPGRLGNRLRRLGKF
jgi:hypothetical protein